ncbi:hypothetical protein AOLI_G00072670 [Acnodon oligacanthus]
MCAQRHSGCTAAAPPVEASRNVAFHRSQKQQLIHDPFFIWQKHCESEMNTVKAASGGRSRCAAGALKCKRTEQSSIRMAGT